MGSLSVRNVDADLIARLKARAVRHGRSAEAEMREILRLALSDKSPGSFEELSAMMRALTAGRSHTPSEVLIREMRDEA